MPVAASADTAVPNRRRHFSRRKVGWEGPAGERGAVVREHEAVGAGTEARVGDNADPPWYAQNC